MHTPCFAACVCPALPGMGVLWGREEEQFGVEGKDAFKQSVDELTAKFQFLLPRLTFL